MSSNWEEDIAIVGMAGVYPQADDIDVFWQNIQNKVDAVTTSNDDWLGAGHILDPTSDDPLQIYTRKGGFLGDLSRFNPMTYGTVPLSVSGGQPDQFLSLKLAYDALTDAGYAPGSFDGTNTGVILGHSVHAHRGNTNGVMQVWGVDQMRTVLQSIFPDADKERLDEALENFRLKMPHLSVEAVPGLVPNVLTGRIANRLDLMGPNYIIDAACSSAIIAADLAITELRAGRADMMLAGGVNTTTSPLVYSVFCSVNALSRDGLIRPFDRRAEGTVLGEGAGILVLKRLSDAIRDDDRIYSVIKGVGQSSDGKSSGLMAPRLEGEKLAVERAYKQTGIDPETIGLLEAHGTGIPLGERTELMALQSVFGSRKGDLPTIPIGSVKSMIGHCIPASGSAAMIKMSMALTNKIIPPQLCEDVNSDSGLDETPFYVSTENRPWTHSSDLPRRAAINAFGFGGINAHMILEEAPGANFVDPTAAFAAPRADVVGTEQVYAFAGADRAALLNAVQACADDLPTDAAFADRAMAAWEAAKGAGPQRLAMVANSPQDLSKKLSAALKKLGNDATTSMQTRNGVYFEAAPLDGKVAFLFPGEMAQYPNMMSDAAMAFPMVREWFDFIGSLTEGQRPVGLNQVTFPATSMVDENGAKILEELMHRVDYGSEMVFAADQATFGLLKSLGVQPNAMLGHSTGENAALVASGLLNMDRAAVGNMIAQMNVVFDDVEKSGTVPTGVLLTIAALPAEELKPLIDAHPDLYFTMDNCPNQAILFGQKDEIDKLESEAVAKGAVCTRLPISWGYHTEHVAPMADKFSQLFDDVDLQESDVTLYSCATASPFPMERDAFKARAREQYISRVRFTDAVNQLYEDGHRVFIECGPNANLTAFVRDILGKRPHLAESADNKRRGMISQLRHVVARLFTAGVETTPEAFLAPQPSDDNLRRAEVRAKQEKAAYLPAELPFVEMDEALIAEFRAVLAPAAAAFAPAQAATAAAPAPGVAPAAPAAPAAAPAQAPRPEVDTGVNQHIALMNQFLHGQGHVARGALAAPHLAGAPEAPAPVRSPIEVLNLSGSFALPFTFRAYLLRGTPSVAAVQPYLGQYELAEAQALAANQSSNAWHEWSLSRLAVKRAAGELIPGTPQNNLMQVLKTDTGVPYLDVAGAGAAPAISLSHVNAMGIGAAADPTWQMGIDFELPSRVRDPGEFMETILSPQERGAINLGVSGQAATTAWSLKEAASKALGVGIQGQPQNFAITDLDPATGRAHVAHGSQILEAQVRQIGDAVCAVAFFAASQ